MAHLTLWGRNLNYRPDGVGDAYKVIARERPRGRVHEWAVTFLVSAKTRRFRGMGFAFDVVVADKNRQG